MSSSTHWWQNSASWDHAAAAPLPTLVPFAAYGSEAAFFLTSSARSNSSVTPNRRKTVETLYVVSCASYLPYFTIASYCFNILLSVSLVSYQSLKVGVVGCSHVHLLWTQTVILLDCGELWFQLLGWSYFRCDIGDGSGAPKKLKSLNSVFSSFLRGDGSATSTHPWVALLRTYDESSLRIACLFSGWRGWINRGKPRERNTLAGILFGSFAVVGL